MFQGAGEINVTEWTKVERKLKEKKNLFIFLNFFVPYILSYITTVRVKSLVRKCNSLACLRCLEVCRQINR